MTAPTTEIRSVLRQGLSKSVVSLAIKIATAGLTYIMFVALSRAMGAEDYGLFAFGFSLATMLAIVASMGQQTAILRYWQEEIGAGRPEAARNALASGWVLTLTASLALSAGLALVALGLGLIGDGLDTVLYLFAAALLILPMAAAEYGSSALRAQGSVTIALSPRDIAWRLIVPASVWALFLGGTALSGAAALALTAFLLGAALMLQALLARMRGYQTGWRGADLGSYWRQHGQASLWFLAGTAVDSAALNIDIVLVGLFVAAESAGVYFNAFRTAGLLTLFMFAMTLVLAPMVSRHYHAGEMRRAQAVTTLCAWAGFLFSLVVFIGFVFFGDLILSLFGESYADGKTVLILLSIGLLADAATGPSRIVMMMTGHERAYVTIFGSIMLAGILAQLVIIPLYGMVAAAAVNALSRIVAQFAIAIWARRNIGIDTSLLGLFDLLRGRLPPRPDAAA